jgi:NhaP-type Na+/H+ or K+/H+ antiporter
MEIAEILGVVLGAFILGFLFSLLARWILKKTKLSYTYKNLIASSIAPLLSLFINQNMFFYYFLVAVVIFIVHQQTDKKAHAVIKPPTS